MNQFNVTLNYTDGSSRMFSHRSHWDTPSYPKFRPGFVLVSHFGRDFFFPVTDIQSMTVEKETL
jgi:hypothetical protein